MSSKKKNKPEWLQCLDCGVIILSKNSSDHYCLNPMPPFVRRSPNSISLNVTGDHISYAKDAFNGDFVKLSLETMIQLELQVGSWCYLDSRSKQSSPFSVRCLPSKDVLPGHIVLPGSLTALKAEFSTLQPLLNSSKETIIKCLLKFECESSDLVAKLIPASLKNILYWKLKGKLLLSGQVFRISIYSVDCQVTVMSWDSLESQMKSLLCESAEQQHTRSVRFGMLSAGSQLEIQFEMGTGLDSTGTVVNFSHVGGYDFLKNKLRKELLQFFNQTSSGKKRRVFGVVLYGCSGVGKTRFARALIGELGLPWTRAITDVNERTSTWDAVSGKCSAYLFEDINHMFRSSSKHSAYIDSSGSTNPVQNLRNFFDNLRRENLTDVLVIATVNDIEILDPCLRRAGYFDLEYEIPPPNPECRFDIMMKMSRSLFSEYFFDAYDLKSISADAYGYISVDLLSVLKLSTQECGDDFKVTLKMLKNSLVRVKPSAMKEIVLDISQVNWDDIGGQDELKAKLKQCIEWPLRNPEKFERFGLKAPRGLLLYGPPGCSKTMIAKALATETGLNFLSVKGPEVYDKYVGQSEKAIRNLFQRARQAAPVIIFFDEIDAIAPSRGSSSTTGVSDRVLTQLLTEMDGIEKLEDVVIVAATNRPDIIDSALLRPGRIDKLFYVPLPDDITRKQIFKIKFRTMPVIDDANKPGWIDLNWLVDSTKGFSGAEVCALCNEAAMSALKRSMGTDCTDEVLNIGDFKEAFGSVRPQTSKKSLEKYEIFAQSSSR